MTAARFSHGMPGDDETQSVAAALVAEAVLARLAKDPAILDALADQLAERIAGALAPRFESRIGSAPPATTSTQPPPDDGAPGEPEVGARLLAWVTEHWSTAVQGNPQQWATATAQASTTPSVLDVFGWARATSCPTSFWAKYDHAIPAPKRDQPNPRSGPLAQMLAEYSAENTHAGATRLIDSVCAEVHSCIQELTARGLHQRPVPARKNALTLLREHDWDAARIIHTIEWGIRNRPHWRSTLTGVPAPVTFNKIDGDWRVDPQNFDLRDVDPAIADQIRTITDGWSYYLSHRLNTPGLRVTARTHKHIHDSLTGADGGDPISDDRLKAFVRWVFRTDSRDAAYYADGNDFPPMRAVRRGLLAMASSTPRTGRLGEGITSTSDGAGGAVGTTIIPVSEV